MINTLYQLQYRAHKDGNKIHIFLKGTKGCTYDIKKGARSICYKIQASFFKK